MQCWGLWYCYNFGISLTYTFFSNVSKYVLNTSMVVQMYNLKFLRP